MALKGVKVLELGSIAPGPFCGMILSDFGATVTKLDKSFGSNYDVLMRGKRKISINMKKTEGKNLVLKLCKNADVLIDPYRPGVLERLGLGPNILLKENSRLIYARLTGFGQTGAMSKMPGHDINFLAMSGLLSMLGREHEKPFPPLILFADFAGGGLLCAFGICAALLEREKSGKGQIVDNSMVEGSAYVGSWLFRSQEHEWFENERGKNLLDGGAHFYNTYKTKDNKYMAVGAVEPQFYSILLEKLNLDPETVSQFNEWENKINKFQEIFITKTQREWSEVFDNSDACVTPVLDWKTVNEHPNHTMRKTFIDKSKTSNSFVPNPAPKLSRTPAESSYLKNEKQEYDTVVEILKEIHLDEDLVKKFCQDGVILLQNNSKL